MTETEHIFIVKTLWRFDQVKEFLCKVMSFLNQINLCSFVLYFAGTRFAETLTMQVKKKKKKKKKAEF